jgi:flagellar assembly protein FliH
MSLSPDLLRSSTNRVIRNIPGQLAPSAQIEQLEALPYTMDGRPITADLRAAKDAGFRKGWDQGWKDGQSEGLVVGRDEAYREFVDALSPVVAAMEAARQRIADVDGLAVEQLAQQVLEFAYEVAEAVIGRELVLSTAPVQEALRRAIALVPDRGDVLARLHPDDVALVQAVDHLLPGRTVTLVADPDIERGGAVVQVDSCRIDAQLGPTLERVRRAIGLAP